MVTLMWRRLPLRPPPLAGWSLKGPVRDRRQEGISKDTPYCLALWSHPPIAKSFLALMNLWMCRCWRFVCKREKSGPVYFPTMAWLMSQLKVNCLLRAHPLLNEIEAHVAIDKGNLEWRSLRQPSVVFNMSDASVCWAFHQLTVRMIK